MNLLIIGSGGREHALGWKLAQSPSCGQLFFAPGNGGTRQLGQNISIPVTDIEQLVAFAEKHACFTVVGPEMPLGMGIADRFRKRGLPILGPDQRGAMLETSKEYAKRFMCKYGVPTAAYEAFDNPEDALRVVEAYPDPLAEPLVIKADGLAAGKGVVICQTKREARQAIENMMRGKIFGSAGEKIVLEQFLTGKEVSLLCFTDGQSILPMDSARDYKRAKDGDIGLNTGGMGSISPVMGFDPEMAKEIVEKTLYGIKAEGFDYRGVLYIGLMLTSDGPKVVEYNARFGDPETEALLPRLDNDLLSVMLAVEARQLDRVTLRWKPQPAVCVVAVSGGYPDSYQTGLPIESIPTESEKAVVFHAGTKWLEDNHPAAAMPNVSAQGKLLTDGGRVLAVTALGEKFAESVEAFKTARANAYKLAEQICFEGCYYRTDIGL